mgnify:FL=1
MLHITIPAGELYNEETGEFLHTKEQKLTLEHSLVSLARWESKWHKPFLSPKPKTREESVDYVRCMTLTQNVDPLSYQFLTPALLRQVTEYIEEPMTATTFSKAEQKKFSREIITAEIIYYWMISFSIPMECQKWHLARLLTLISVCDRKNSPGKKMSKKELYAQNRALNEARCKARGTRG